MFFYCLEQYKVKEAHIPEYRVSGKKALPLIGIKRDAFFLDTLYATKNVNVVYAEKNFFLSVKLAFYLFIYFFLIRLLQLRQMGNSRQFLKTTGDWKAFFYKFYELKSLSKILES